MTEQSKGKVIKRKIVKILGLGAAVIIGILLITILSSFINHKVKLSQEADLFNSTFAH